LCKKYSRSKKSQQDLNQAWDLYYHVFRRLDKQLKQMTTLELQCVPHSSMEEHLLTLSVLVIFRYVSPNLLEARNLELAVPGTYEAHTGEVRQFFPLGGKNEKLDNPS